LQKECIEKPCGTLLKIDKDHHPSAELERRYIQTVLLVIANQGLRVAWIKRTRTRHGRHYYVQLVETLTDQAANDLQYLLGGDAKRVAWNQQRINSGLPDWNKLFEEVGRHFEKVYENPRYRKRQSLSHRR
jgi:hypothetical protein